MTEETSKQAYEAPQLRVHGSIEAITQGASSGQFLDADFPDGFPVSDLTFS